MTCPACGHESNAKFCPECGTPLTAAAPAPSREERKVVTVLFADLVGFTSRAEQMDPEDVRALLGPYHARLRELLENYGGTVEKFIGDAVMALFGAPVAHEDDAERAVRAALAIRDWVREEDELQVRVAVNTGEALISLDARPEHGEGMASGDVVNATARLQAAAPVNGIIVGESTYRATGKVIEYRPAEPVDAKGKTDPIPVWEVVEARSRFGVDVRQAPVTALVGRARERALLAETLARVREERSPQLVTLVGVPGIGKSRLVWELFEHVGREPDLITWRQGRSLPYGEGVAFWALGEIVKAQAGILETDDADVVKEKLEGAVRALIDDERDADWVVQHLGPLTGVETTDAAGERGEAFAAWRRFIESLADRRPLVLVFEDLHFADAALLDFVDELVDWASGVPLLVLGTARPELLARRPAWGGGKANAVTISLSPLSDEETAVLVHAVLGRSAVEVELRGAVLERAGGNPLYAEEFARLVAAGREPAELPETVQGIVAARLDLLQPEEKDLVYDAAVVGKVFWLGTLEAMSGRERRQLERSLHALERTEFIQRARAPSVAGEPEYAFRHILVQDVAYGQIPRSLRAEKHLSAARWIESLGRAEDHAEMLAHHYVSALDLAAAAGVDTTSFAARARSALKAAGDRALALHSYAAAARFYERALDLSGDDTAEPELLFGFGRALMSAGDDRAPAALERARDVFRVGGESGRAGEAAALLAEFWWHRGQRNRARPHLDEARALVESDGATPSKALVLSQVARYLGLAGQTQEAVEAGREAIEIAESLSLEEVAVHALTSVGSARVVGGDVVGGFADLESAIERGVAINTPVVSRAYNNLGSMLYDTGERRRSTDLIREAVRVAERFGDHVQARFSGAILIWDDYSNGRWDEFVANARAFIREGERAGGSYQDAYFMGSLAVIAAARDEENALADAEAALARAREVGDPQIVNSVLVDIAFIETELGELDAARAHALECVEAGHFTPSLGLIATHLGIESAVREVRDGARPDDPTARATRALLDRDYVAAADALAELEERPLEAHARLRAAEELVAQGRRAEADEQLARTLAFWRSVGASRYVREGEHLLARTA